MPLSVAPPPSHPVHAAQPHQQPFLVTLKVLNISRPLLFFTEEWLRNTRLSHTRLSSNQTAEPLPGNRARTGTPTHCLASTFSGSYLVSCVNHHLFQERVLSCLLLFPLIRSRLHFNSGPPFLHIFDHTFLFLVTSSSSPAHYHPKKNTTLISVPNKNSLFASFAFSLEPPCDSTSSRLTPRFYYHNSFLSLRS